MTEEVKRKCKIGLHDKVFINHDPEKHRLPIDVLYVIENNAGVYINLKCKHEFIVPANSFEAPYCKHCFKCV
jgi:hypothetical protein